MKIKFWTSAFLIFIYVQLQAQQQNLLSGKFTADEWKDKLIPQANWMPFPKMLPRSATAISRKYLLIMRMTGARKLHGGFGRKRETYTFALPKSGKIKIWRRFGDSLAEEVNKF